MEGYDAKFEPPLNKRLECPICLLALREPMQTPCGHRFCAPCITRALGETGKRCPVDNTAVDYGKLFKDNFAKREVLCLNVLCSACEIGCSWHGELRDLQEHSELCELVTVACPHQCGHNCQRKFLSPHMSGCSNQPQPCPLCSVAFIVNKLEEHKSQCSKLKVAKSILSDICEANEVLKWTGQIKVKMNKHHGNLPNIHLTGYLTAKAETPESFTNTSNWHTHLNVMTLNTGASQVFQEALRSPEVSTLQFFFHFLVKDKSHVFTNLLKGKSGDQAAAVGLHLKATPTRHDLTVMYFSWSESKKRIIATVADLNCLTVRHIHNRLQSLLQTSRRSRGSGSSSRGHSSRTHPPLSVEHRPHYHRHHHATPTTILPHLLSSYPWRVQNSVPFFTFPSTPPQYLPSNSYPYTFAPMPAAPFPMQPVVTHGLPIANEQIPVAVTLGNPNPSVVSVNVIQQPVIQGPAHQDTPNGDLTIIHSLGHQHFQPAHVTPMPAHVTPIPAHVTPMPTHMTPMPAHMTPMPAHVTPMPAHVTPLVQPIVQAEHGVIQSRPSLASHVTPMSGHVIPLEQSGIGMASNSDGRSADSTIIWGNPSMPGGHDTIDSRSSSPRLSPIYYQDSDSSVDTPLDSTQAIIRGISSQHDSSFSSSGSNEGPLQTLASGSLDMESPEAPPTSEEEPLRLPVLISIPDSDMESPDNSVIDLTSSPPLATPTITPSQHEDPPLLVPVIHDRETMSRRNFDQEEQFPEAIVPGNGILATNHGAMLRGGMLSHTPSHPMVVGRPNTLGIPAANVQVLGWQPPQPQQAPPEVMGGHLNILVPPNVVPAAPFPQAVIPARGEFWERVMPSLDMTLQNSTSDPRPAQQ